MSEKQRAAAQCDDACRKQIELIFEGIRREYSKSEARLRTLFADVVALFAGQWPAYEACLTGYHNLGHSLDVTLAVVRMTIGWNMQEREKPLPAQLFRAGVAAALFHDSGYLKDRGDTEGRGGKYSFSHVDRSVRLAVEYLTRSHWPAESKALVKQLILPTAFLSEHQPAVQLGDSPADLMARIVSTADLIAQMADVDYLSKIHGLYEEFAEAYRFENTEELMSKGVKIYSSAQEILDNTLTFYENYVLPRLESLGRMDRYLTVFFADGRNPYQENIAANISYHYVHSHSRWRRLGEILEQLGIVTRDQITHAMEEQSRFVADSTNLSGKRRSEQENRLLPFFSGSAQSQRLGEILLDMEIIEQKDLCHGLMAQILPPSLLETLTAADLLFLLQASVLLQNINQGSRMMQCIMELAMAFTDCEAASIRRIDTEAGETVVTMAAGTLASSVDLRLPADKNLAGWVHHHQRPVAIKDVADDWRFNARRGKTVIIRSVLMAPIPVNGRCVGVFELVNKSTDDFSNREKDIIACLANMIGFSLGNVVLDRRQNELL
jgi:HD superfamily phosphodiesterase